MATTENRFRYQAFLKRPGLKEEVDTNLYEAAQTFTSQIIQSIAASSLSGTTAAEIATIQRGLRREPENFDLQKSDFDIPQLLDYIFTEWENYKLNGLPLLGESELSARYPHINVNDSESIKIATHLFKREMGIVAKEGIHGGPVRALKPVYRGTIKDPGHPGYSIHIFEYIFDNWIVFSLGAKSPKDAEIWSFVLEEFLISNRWKWMQAGVIDFQYEGSSASPDSLGFQKPAQVELQYMQHLTFRTRTIRTTRLLEHDIERFYIELHMLDEESYEAQT